MTRSILMAFAGLGLLTAISYLSAQSVSDPRMARMAATSSAPATSAPSGKLANTKCPIMLVPVSEPIRPELTRMYKGTKIGFCCPACPPQWDKLTDAEKETKLKAAGWTGPATK